MAQKIQYDVLVKENGNWGINSSHEEFEKDKAIEIAKSLEVQTNIDTVKVVREVFDSENMTTNTSTVYTPGRLWL